MALDKDLEIQERLFGLTDDLKLVYKLREIIQNLSDGRVWGMYWRPLIDVDFYKDEKTNQTYRTHTPSKLFREILRIKTE